MQPICASQNFRILIVDDDPPTGAALAFQYGREPGTQCPGPFVVTATRGKQALELLAVQPFQLMLVDFGLPDFTGAEVVRLARQEGSVAATLVYSARPTGGWQVEALRAGADHAAHLADVFDSNEAVERALQRAVSRATQAEGRRAQAADMAPLVDPEALVPSPARLREVERAHIERVARDVGRDPKLIAGILGVSLPTLRRRARALRIRWDLIFRPYKKRGQ
jgi:DNA-binding response OmpR family regulator